MVEPNKIYNENCLETMARMDDGSIDLVVTSPPYDNLRDYKGYSFDFEAIAKELYRVIKKGGVVVWVVNDSTVDGSETLTSCKQKIFFRERCGFNIHDTMIYEKDGIPLNSGNRYEPKFEYMIVLSKGKPITTNLLMEKSTTAGSRRYRGRAKTDNSAEQAREERTVVNELKVKGNIWYYDVGKNDGTNHPAPFPEALAKDHIYSWSNEGEIVYDPFGGSGTTAKMAHLAKRNWILSEISSEYCELAEKRIRPYIQQQQLF